MCVGVCVGGMGAERQQRVGSAGGGINALLQQVQQVRCTRLRSPPPCPGALCPLPFVLYRLAMTSFAFMFDCVPLPVCQMTSGK